MDSTSYPCASDFVLFTDGSGHQDGYGGWAALVKSTTRPDLHNIRMGGMTQTSVDRMEMTAMVEGLHMTLALAGRVAPQGGRLNGKHSVIWFSDRESLIKSALGEYGRGNSTDLWNQYAWFETQLTIIPIHVRREVDHEEFRSVDLHASTIRIILKNYDNSIRNIEPSSLSQTH